MKNKRKNKKKSFFFKKKSKKKSKNKTFHIKKINGKELLSIVFTACMLSVFVLFMKYSFFSTEGKISAQSPKIEEDFLTVSEYNRPGIPLRKVKGIVVHYVANPGSTAKENRDYFEGLSQTHATKASSHFVIGLKGEIVQCIPLEEISYASNDRNFDTISIECCHPGKDGKFTKETYDSLVKLVSFLCEKYNINIKKVIRHYDVTGKMCPLYYVEHPDSWKQFRIDVKKFIKKQENK